MLESVASNGAYAVIVSNAIEIVLFGIYTIFFTFAVLILTAYKKPLPVHRSMVIATSVVYVTCMAHCSVVTTDRHTAFTSGWPIPSGPEMSMLLRLNDMLFKVCGFLSQLVMIHRCWAVWDYRYSVVVAPLTMSLCGMICALVSSVSLKTSQFVSPFVPPRNLGFDMAFLILSLCVYVLATSLIAVHLRRVSAPVHNVRSMEALVWSLVGACIEAGALLALAQLPVVVLLVLDHPGILIAESIAAQIYGIAPTIMIIRLGLSLIPRGQHRRDTSSFQFSSFVIDTIYPSEDSDHTTELREA